MPIYSCTTGSTVSCGSPACVFRERAVTIQPRLEAAAGWRVAGRYFPSTWVNIRLGLGVALLAGSALGSLLIGVGSADPVSFGSAVLVLLLVGTAASYVPARSASSVDPSTALRSE